MSTSSSSLPRPSGEVLMTELPDGESVLLDLRTEAYFGLNELGTAVWGVLSDGGDIDALVSRTSNDTGVDTTVIRADIDALIGELSARGLVTSDGDSGD